MYYTIYKTTNKINGKYYIGAHKTDNLDDGYFGSGIILNRAIEKYGIENFKREILFCFNNPEEMWNKEQELVIVDEFTYNIKSGGDGGFDYINENKLYNTNNMIEWVRNPLNKEKIKEYSMSYRINKDSESYKKWCKNLSISSKKYYENHENSFKNKTHTEEAKKKIGKANSVKQKGSGNSNFGKCWITNGTENKSIKKEQLDEWIEKGYYKGRI